MTEAPWARASLRVDSENFGLDRLTEVLGPATAGSSFERWILECGESSAEPVHLQLARLESLLKERVDVLIELGRDVDTTVLISWTPMAGQDGLALPSSLIGLLGRIGATVLVDTYTDE